MPSEKGGLHPAPANTPATFETFSNQARGRWLRCNGCSTRIARKWLHGGYMVATWRRISPFKTLACRTHTVFTGYRHSDTESAVRCLRVFARPLAWLHC